MKIHKTREFDRPADEIWELIGDFHGLHKWVPGLPPSESVEDGKCRKFGIGAGGEIVERLLDTGERSYTYTIDEGPFPVVNYRSTLSVKDAGDGRSIVDWQGEFEPAEGATDEAGAQMVEMVYEAGLSGLEQTLSK